MASALAIDNLDALRDLLRKHNDAGTPVGSIELTGLNSVRSLSAADMTVKVWSGISLKRLQSRLAEFGQWLPVDPWDTGVSIKHLLDENLYGPRRYGFGTVREHLIGMETMLPDGRLVESGGDVVKNVAGYDLQKVFIGARQSLGIIVSATFKLLPRPDSESFVESGPITVPEAERRTRQILDSPMVPTVLDWADDAGNDRVNVVVGFSGSNAEVEWQLEQLDADDWIASKAPKHDSRYFNGPGRWRSRSSVLPTRLGESVRQLNGQSFVARAGNGVFWSPEMESVKGRGPAGRLETRLKQTFDPGGIMPDMDDER